MLPLLARDTLFPYTTLFRSLRRQAPSGRRRSGSARRPGARTRMGTGRSEEHTSELQSRLHLVCRLLLEKKNSTAVSVSSNSLVLYSQRPCVACFASAVTALC